MALIRELKIQSIVILAENFNPSLFSSTWLSKNGFINDGSILPNSIFTPQITSVFTGMFNLLVVPNQIQFIVNSDDILISDVIRDTVMPIIKKLGDGIPYTALGINFHWFIRDDQHTVEKTSRNLFFDERMKISQAFDQPNAMFGSYMSMDFEGSRLKLDIKPVHAIDQINGQFMESIQCTFNFHSDITAHDSEQVLSTISKWELYREMSNKLISLLQ